MIYIHIQADVIVVDQLVSCNFTIVASAFFNFTNQLNLWFVGKKQLDAVRGCLLGVFLKSAPCFHKYVKTKCTAHNDLALAAHSVSAVRRI